jgi:hypothetical protein
MKIFFRLVLLVSLLSLAPCVFAQDTLDTFNVSEVVTVNPLGDGVMTMTFTLTARQFANWQSKYGQDEGLLRRDMNNNYTGQFETSDWAVKTDSMNRTIAVSVAVRGFVIPRGGGVFEFRVPKQWRGGERSGTTYSYNFVEPIGGGAVGQTNVKLVLPETASHFVGDKSETGDPIIQYKVPVGGMGGILLWGGIALAVLGAVLAVIALAALKDAPAAPPPQMPAHA